MHQCGAAAGRNYLLAGVPWTWLEAAPAGQVIIDPTISVGGGEDVWIEDSSNKNGSSAGLLVGKAGCCPKKRTLIKFDLANSGIPGSAQVLKATVRLNYYAKVTTGGGWIDRRINANQVLVDWLAGEAAKDIRKTGVAWSLPYGAINGTDVKATAESSVLFTATTPMPSFQYWDLTSLAQQWVNGAAANYGVVLWADNEDVAGYDCSLS